MHCQVNISAWSRHKCEIVQQQRRTETHRKPDLFIFKIIFCGRGCHIHIFLLNNLMKLPVAHKTVNSLIHRHITSDLLPASAPMRRIRLVQGIRR